MEKTTPPVEALPFGAAEDGSESIAGWRPDNSMDSPPSRYGLRPVLPNVRARARVCAFLISMWSVVPGRCRTVRDKNKACSRMTRKHASFSMV